MSLLYMFRATMCPSSGETTVSMRHWYLSFCMGGVSSAGWSETPTSVPDAIHTEWQIPVSHGYSVFSWWWAHGCPKHVQERHKYTKQNCAPIWIYLQDCTRMHGQQNIKCVITQFAKLAAGEQLCRPCTHRKLQHFETFKSFSWTITNFDLWHCCRKWAIYSLSLF